MGCTDYKHTCICRSRNKDARYLCADALEQLGYQAESGAWRNAYLTGAYELRNGTKIIRIPKVQVQQLSV